MPQTGYLIEKNEEAYAKVFTIHYPDEERVAARPLRQTPCYSRMKELGAVFGSIYGWERPDWFAPQGYGLSEADLARPDVLLNENHPPASGRASRARNGASAVRTISNSSAPSAATCTRTLACRTCRLSPNARSPGPAPRRGSNSILTNRIPKALGRVTLTYLLTARGGVRAEFTLTRIGPQRFYLVSAGALEAHDFDTLEKLLPGGRQRTPRQGDDAARRPGPRRAAVARGAGQGRRRSTSRTPPSRG